MFHHHYQVPLFGNAAWSRPPSPFPFNLSQILMLSPCRIVYTSQLKDSVFLPPLFRESRESLPLCLPEIQRWGTLLGSPPFAAAEREFPSPGENAADGRREGCCRLRRVCLSVSVRSQDLTLYTHTHTLPCCSCFSLSLSIPL